MPITVSEQVHHFFSSLPGLGHCVSVFNSYTDSKVCVCAASLSLGDKPTCHFTKMDNQKKELDNKDESTAKEKNGDAGSEIWIK